MSYTDTDTDISDPLCLKVKKAPYLFLFFEEILTLTSSQLSSLCNRGGIEIS